MISQHRRTNIFWATSKVVWPAGGGMGLSHFPLMRPHLEHCIWLQHRRDTDLLDQIYRRTTKIIRDIEQFCGKAENFGIVHPGEEKVMKRPHSSFSIPKGAYRIAGEGLHTNACSDRI